VDELIGRSAADALFAEVAHFPGRIGIVHRDFPEMVARDDTIALTQYHLILYWARTFDGRGTAVRENRL
jgi:hypothetical protein